MALELLIAGCTVTSCHKFTPPEVLRQSVGEADILVVAVGREGKQALVMMKAHAYRLVVVDRLDGEPDAYQVCRTAKQTRQPNGQPPVVIMFAPSAGSMDRIKAGLAGSDAYLSRSVAESEFYKVLAQHRLVSLDGFAKTNVGF